jgi:amidase
VTRTVRDAAALLDAVCGPAPGDRYYVRRPERPFAAEAGADPGPLRIAMQTESYWGNGTDPEVRGAVETVARILEEQGHRVEQAAPPVDADAFRTLHLIVWPWLVATLATTLGEIAGREPSEADVETATLACIRHTRETGALDISKASALQNAISRAWGAFLDDFDLFLSPTTPDGPSPAGVPPADDPVYADIERWIDDFYGISPYTPVANTTGQPAISLPLGTATDGMPIGVMLTAQTLQEDLLIRVAAQLETAMPWADRRPGVYAG